MEWLTSIRTAGAGCPATPKVSEGTVPHRYGLVCRVECPQALITKCACGSGSIRHKCLPATSPFGTGAHFTPAPSYPVAKRHQIQTND